MKWVEVSAFNAFGLWFFFLTDSQVGSVKTAQLHSLLLWKKRERLNMHLSSRFF